MLEYPIYLQAMAQDLQVVVMHLSDVPKPPRRRGKAETV